MSCLKYLLFLWPVLLLFSNPISKETMSKLELVEAQQLSTGFEPMTFAIPVQTLYHWATRSHGSSVNCKLCYTSEIIKCDNVHYTTGWEISAIWLAVTSCISA